MVPLSFASGEPSNAKSVNFVSYVTTNSLGEGVSAAKALTTASIFALSSGFASIAGSHAENKNTKQMSNGRNTFFILHS